MLHLYKNRLQHYAQKHTLDLPVYSCEFDGPPHARRFSSKVIVGDKTFETSELFSTLKEAEQAAAKVAFESLSHDDTQEDESLYKTLLQQFAQKEGLPAPTYVTTKSGAAHIPTFISTLEIGDDVFQGQEAKSKKLAEMRVARIAYNALIERRARQTAPCRYDVKGASEVANLRVDGGLKQEIVNIQTGDMDEATQNKDSNLKGALKISSSSMESLVTAVLEKNVQPKAEFIYSQEPDEVQAAKRQTLIFIDGASVSTPLMGNPNCLDGESEHLKPAGLGLLSCSKVIVYPRNSDMAIPDGSSVLPFSDDKWVAVELNQKQ